VEVEDRKLLAIAMGTTVDLEVVEFGRQALMVSAGQGLLDRVIPGEQM